MHKRKKICSHDWNSACMWYMLAQMSSTRLRALQFPHKIPLFIHLDVACVYSFDNTNTRRPLLFVHLLRFWFGLRCAVVVASDALGSTIACLMMPFSSWLNSQHSTKDAQEVPFFYIYFFFHFIRAAINFAGETLLYKVNFYRYKCISICFLSD